MSWETQGRQGHGWFGHDKAPGGASPGAARGQTGSAAGAAGRAPGAAASGAPGPGVGLATAENVEALARIIQSEAGGVESAKAAVGWTVRNRMERNGTVRVGDVQSAYAYGANATDGTRQIARAILDGTMADPTNGATHFYTPSIMPKEHDSSKPGLDTKGGLETVEGVKRNNQPVRSYKPGFADSPDFIQRPMPGIPESSFKFFAPLRDGHVR